MLPTPAWAGSGPEPTGPGVLAGLDAEFADAGDGVYLNPQADLYALGVLLWHLLCGRPPFAEPDPGALLARLWQPPPPLGWR